jgi:hypothetical protein
VAESGETILLASFPWYQGKLSKESIVSLGLGKYFHSFPWVTLRVLSDVLLYLFGVKPGQPRDTVLLSLGKGNYSTNFPWYQGELSRESTVSLGWGNWPIFQSCFRILLDAPFLSLNHHAINGIFNSAAKQCLILSHLRSEWKLFSDSLQFGERVHQKMKFEY